MPSRTDLVPIDAEEFLVGIQRQIEAGKHRSANQGGAVQFFHPLSLHISQKQAPAHPSEENFCEQDYLLSNPDVSDAIERGEFKSGFDHWLRVGKQEGRSFEPAEFNEIEYLELNPDVVELIRDGLFASGRDHWRRRGRLEGRNIKIVHPMSLSHLKRLSYEMQVRLNQMGESPPNPGTLRGTAFATGAPPRAPRPHSSPA